MTRLLSLLALAAFALARPALAADPTTPRQPPTLTVFAAASLTNAMTALREEYRARSGVELKLMFASSSILARQVEAGARADVFISADQEWMDYLQARNLVDRASRRDIVGNELVLVAPATSTLALRIAPGFALAAALGPRGRLATGDPESVPAGRYARAALVTLGVWDEVAERVVRADNVRTALNFVARGEAPLGIVYTTDALVEPRVRIVDRFPDATHLPILYPAAALRDADPAARAFVTWLASAEARAVFKRFGFREPP